MQIGNAAELEASRLALRDQFDAIWLASDTLGPREARAIRCASKLDKPRHDRGAWIIFPGGRATHYGPIIAGVSATLDVVSPAGAIGRDMFAAMQGAL